MPGINETKERIIDSLRAKAASHQTTAKNHTIQIPKNRKQRLCLFAHYSSDNTVCAYVYHLIQSLSQSGCDVLFISAGRSLNTEDQQKIKANCIGLICRKNIGYDFGSWKTAIEYYPNMTQDYQSIIFTNDSIYGPIHKISPLIDKVESLFDVWSLTSSHERNFHLQSYFWGVTSKAIQCGFFDSFWQKHYRYYSLRNRVITKYELQIARIAKDKYFLNVGSAIDPLEYSSNTRDLRKINPTHHLGYELITRHKFPFIKRELLDRNPLNIESKHLIEKYLQTEHPHYWALISKN